MAWTTSADPWANHVRTSRGDWVGRQLGRIATIRDVNPPAVLQIAATLHLGMLAVLLPVVGDAGVAALALASGLALSVAALLVPRRGGEADARETLPSTIALAARPDDAALSEPLLAGTCQLAACSAAGAGEVMRPNVNNPEWADLMARMSHELRTPLNAVLGFSDLMHKGLFGPLGHERYHEYARHIHDSGRELLKSAEDTLAVTSLLARPAQGSTTEAMLLKDLVRDAEAFFGDRPATRGTFISLDVAPDLEVLGERRALRQALINLLSEGLARATPGADVSVTATAALGRIELRIRVDATDSAVQRDPGSLHVCLARTLLEFHGAELVEDVKPGGQWQVSTRLDQASQHDFFEPSRRTS